MSEFTIERYAVGDLGANCYFVIHNNTQKLVIVDPGGDGRYLIDKIKERKLIPEAILLTHGHFDHACDADLLKKEFQIPVYAHEEERQVLETPEMNLSGEFGRMQSYYADCYVKDNDILKLGGATYQVLWTPGHTNGGACYYLQEEQILFSGDTLFAGSIGRTDFPTGAMNTLLSSIRQKVFTLPDEVVVLPGHMSQTTIGQEKKSNPFLQ